VKCSEHEEPSARSILLEPVPQGFFLPSQEPFQLAGFELIWSWFRFLNLFFSNKVAPLLAQNQNHLYVSITRAQDPTASNRV